MKKMKRFSEFLRITIFFWRSRLSIDAKKKEKTERKSSAHIRDGTRGKTHSSISPSACEGGGGGGGYPLHLDYTIAFYAGGFMNNYFSHFEELWGSLLNTMNTLKFKALTSDLKGSK